MSGLQYIDKFEQYLHKSYDLEQRFALRAHAGRLLPSDRVANCGQPFRGQVKIFYSPRYNKLFYSNIQTCSSVWKCPVCSVKIALRRSSEVEEAMQRWPGQVVFSTFTLSHTAKDSFSSLLHDMKSSTSYVHSKSKAWSQFKQDFDFYGNYTSYETTFGYNGFNPHKHGLMFFDQQNPSSLDDMKEALYPIWHRALQRQGRYCSFERGVHLRHADSTDYLFSAAKEISSLPVKIGGRRSYSPIELLQLSRFGHLQARRLWLDYAKSSYRRWHLYSTQGLKQTLGIKDKTDQEVNNEFRDTALPVANIKAKSFAELDHKQRSNILNYGVVSLSELEHLLTDNGLPPDLLTDYDWFDDVEGMDW